MDGLGELLICGSTFLTCSWAVCDVVADDDGRSSVVDGARVGVLKSSGTDDEETILLGSLTLVAAPATEGVRVALALFVSGRPRNG